VNAVWITNIPRALSKQRIACGSPMGAQKQFPDVTERLCSETSGPPSSGEGPRGFCASTSRGFEMRCFGETFPWTSTCLWRCYLVTSAVEAASPARKVKGLLFAGMTQHSLSCGMFVMDCPFRTGAIYHETVISIL
jgi:hypothetical protein